MKAVGKVAAPEATRHRAFVAATPESSGSVGGKETPYSAIFWLPSSMMNSLLSIHASPHVPGLIAGRQSQRMVFTRK